VVHREGYGSWLIWISSPLRASGGKRHQTMSSRRDHYPVSIPSAIGSVQGSMGLELIYPGLGWRPPEDFKSNS
jgi:hypothetical protein